MSDEQPGSHQQGQPAQPEPPAGDHWGDPISDERQAELKALADQQRAWAAAPDHHGRESYFRDVPLTGADVLWLAAYALDGPEGDVAAAQDRLRNRGHRGEYIDLSALHLESASLFSAHLEGATLDAAHLEGADLIEAYLEGTNLRETHLEGANLGGAHLERTYLTRAHLEGATLFEAHLERADLYDAHLEGANLGGAHLEGAGLGGAHLEGAFLREAHLEGAGLGAAAHRRGAGLGATAHRERARLFAAHLDVSDLIRAHLEGAGLGGAHLEGADLGGAHLEESFLNEAHLEGATLFEAHLEGAFLRVAHLEGADLYGAHLEGADLAVAHLGGKTYPAGPVGNADLQRIRQWANDFPAPLPPADLRRLFLNEATNLNDIHLGDAKGGTVQVADLRWGEVNLAVVDWTPFTDRKAVLGDEQAARDWKPEPFTETEEQRKRPRQERARARAEHNAQQEQERLRVYQAAVRANRQLATVLRDQGMNEEADHFAYRAQVVQRWVFHLQGKRLRAGFSRFLNLLAGYGYKPERSLYTYLIVLAVFTGLYLLASDGLLTFGLPRTAIMPLQWYEGLVLSVSSFHGRGFFQPLQNPGDPIAILAATEAVLGLLIEISFIATFTQRFFGSK